MQYKWRNEIAREIFYRKYALTQSDTWPERCRQIVDDVCGTMHGRMRKILGDSERDFLVKVMTEMKFIPGGRYIYYAGRPAHFWNNCFKRGTKVLTDRGWRNVEELGSAMVFSPVTGNYLPAEFHKHGKQKLQNVTFTSVRGNQDTTFSVLVTRNHRWILKNGSDTTDLRVGDIVPANKFSYKPDDLGFVHGYVFGDGNRKGQLRLCSERDKSNLKKLSEFGTVTYPPFANGDPVIQFNQDINWKNLPVDGSTPEYISGFIQGWIQSDGYLGSGKRLCSISKDNLEWFREHAAYAGLVITGKLRSQVRDTTIGQYEYKDHEIFIQSFQEGSSYTGFKVVSIERDVSEEEVYCPYEPMYQEIVIDHNIHTGNCFLLRVEEDTREEWAALVNKATSCLMVGGGIGADYSIVRPKGRSIARTGGIASGPLSLMEMTNEVGRHVMQGGARRSAIYASLNWRHDDAKDLLGAKDWDNILIPGTQLTIGDMKRLDFNYRAPLDMTNISLNYDDDFLQAKGLPEIFVKNVLMACKNGEPGFSFNFGIHSRETLRNA